MTNENTIWQKVGAVIYKAWKFYISISMVINSANADTTHQKSILIDANELNFNVFGLNAMDALYVKSALDTQELLNPIDRPPLEKSLLVFDGGLGCSSALNWKEDKKLDQELKNFKNEITGKSLSIIIQEYKQLAESNKEFAKFINDDHTEEQAMQAIAFLSHLSDMLRDSLSGLKFGFGTHAEFATTAGLLTVCQMKQQNSIKRLEIISAKNKKGGYHGFVVANRNYSSSLHKYQTWGKNYKIIDAWFNNNQLHGVYSKDELPKILTDIDWQCWESKDITPPNLIDAPNVFIDFFNRSIRNIFDFYSKKVPLGLNRFTQFCNPNLFEHHSTHSESTKNSNSKML